MKVLFFLSLIISLKAQSLETPPICEDLATPACANLDEAIEDGSGRSLGRIEFHQRLLKAMDQAKLATPAFRDPQLRKDLIETFQIAECVQEGPACDRALSEKAMLLVQKQLRMAPEGTDFSNFDAAGLKSIMSHWEFRELRGQLQTAVEKEFPTATLQGQVEKEIFPDVQRILERKLDEWNIKEPMRSRMKERIRTAQYDSRGCTRPLSQSMDYFLPRTTNVIVSDSPGQVSLCDGFLIGSTSKFAAVFTLAHELSHFIDPCNVTQPQGGKSPLMKYKSPKGDEGTLKEYPLPNVPQCLRSPNSAAAKLDIRSQSLCGWDQLREAVPDWMAAEVLATYVQEKFSGLRPEQKQKAYLNVARTFCYGREAQKPVHPKTATRMNQVLLAQPAVRSQMECYLPPPKAIYCSPSSSAGLPKPPVLPPGQRGRK